MGTSSGGCSCAPRLRWCFVWSVSGFTSNRLLRLLGNTDFFARIEVFGKRENELNGDVTPACLGLGNPMLDGSCWLGFGLSGFCFLLLWKGLGYHAAFLQDNGAAIIQLFRDCLFCILALNIGQQLSESFNLGVCRGFFVAGNKGELFNFPIYLSETFSPSCECVVQQSEVLQSRVSHLLIRDVVKHFNKHLLNQNLPAL